MYIYLDFSSIQWGLDTGENRPITEREADTEIMMTLLEQSWELVRVFIEANKKILFFFLFDQADSDFKNMRRVFIKYIFKFIAVKTYSYKDPVSFKGQCQEIFCFRFLSWIIFPQAPENNITGILIFSKICGDIRKWRCTTGINDTSGKFYYRYRWCCWYQRQIFQYSQWHRLQIMGKIILLTS